MGGGVVMTDTITLDLTPDQLDLVFQSLNGLRSDLYRQEATGQPLQAITAQKRLKDLLPLEEAVLNRVNQLYEPNRVEKGVQHA